MNIDWDDVIGLILAGAACAALLFGISAVILGARSSGSPDYCVPVVTSAETMTTYRLVAHRPWKPDWNVGAFLTFAEAASAAERLGCPFKSAP